MFSRCVRATGTQKRANARTDEHTNIHSHGVNDQAPKMSKEMKRRKWRVKNWLNSHFKAKKKKKKSASTDETEKPKDRKRSIANILMCIVTGVRQSVLYAFVIFQHEFDFIFLFRRRRRRFCFELCLASGFIRCAHQKKLFPLRKLLNAFNA